MNRFIEFLGVTLLFSAVVFCIFAMVALVIAVFKNL